MLEPSLFSPGTVAPDELLESPRSLDAQALKSIAAAKPNIVAIAKRFMLARAYRTSLRLQALDV
jgi:hypothetical protein